MSDQINVNAIADTLNNKMDLDMENLPANIDFVVDSKNPTNDDPSWYRLYRSGWLEQGGVGHGNGSTSQTITFSKSFANTNYYFNSVVDISKSTGSYNLDAFAGARSTDSMVVWLKNGNGSALSTDYFFFWEVKGLAAQS